MSKWISTLKNRRKTFLDTVSKSNEMFFYILLCLFIASNTVILINWRGDLFIYAWKAHFFMFAAVMWGSAIYLFSIIAEWRNAWNRTKELVLIGIIAFVLAGITSKIVTTDSYAFVMGAFLCIAACGKDYRKIIYCFLGIILVTLLLALLGLKLGVTVDAVKPYRVYGGHSLGILYPNNWGYFVFAFMMLIWYLFLRNRRIITILFFWSIAVFMYCYITCITVAGMAFLFPFMAILSEFLQRKDRVTDNSHKALSWFIIILPFIFIAVMLLFCWQMDFIHDVLYNTPFRSMAMRFVEGGYSLRLNGVNLFGHPFRQWDGSVIEYSKEIEMIVDSGYICYLIIRGAVAMFLTLLWLSIAHKKALKIHDYRIIAISFFMHMLAMMERPGLDVWYNFVFLYPLAKVSSE